MVLRENLEQRLEEKGLERDFIPGFMRSLAHTLAFTPHASPQQVHMLMRSMGWNIRELDAHTLQLAMASIEFESPAGRNYGSRP